MTTPGQWIEITTLSLAGATAFVVAIVKYKEAINRLLPGNKNPPKNPVETNLLVNEDHIVAGAAANVIFEMFLRRTGSAAWVKSAHRFEDRSWDIRMVLINQMYTKTFGPQNNDYNRKRDIEIWGEEAAREFIKNDIEILEELIRIRQHDNTTFTHSRIFLESVPLPVFGRAGTTNEQELYFEKVAILFNDKYYVIGWIRTDLTMAHRETKGENNEDVRALFE